MTFISRLAAFCALVFSTVAIAAPLHGPHEHGTLSVALVKEDSFLTFKVVATGEDLLGFEDSPKTPEKKKTLSDQYEKLYKEDALSKLFKFIPADTCWAYSADIDSEMLDYHEHDEGTVEEKTSDPKDVHEVVGENGHTDFELIYTFECDEIELLQITFHEVFPSINKVNFYGRGEVGGDVLFSVPADEAVIPGSELE